MGGSEILTSPDYRCWAEIDLGALERNLKAIRSGLPTQVRQIAVVKANAYGHGMAPTVTRMMQAGVDLFAVANLQEAQAIRELGSGWPILLLGPILPHEEAALEGTRDILPSISSLEEVHRLSAVARRAQRKIAAHLKIDTGMGRAGIWHEQADPVISAIEASPEIELRGVFTHFASATSDPDFTAHQRKVFLDTLERTGLSARPGLWIHADNSAGLRTFDPALPFSAVRTGLLQFGLRPPPDSLLSQIKVEPVLSLYSQIGLIKTLPAGTGISYGRLTILDQSTRVGLITAGYGDGLSTTMTGRGQVLVHGRRCPMLGRITMDQTLVDLSGVPESQVGDRVTLIGKDGTEVITAHDFAEWRQAVPWEVFSSLSPRVKRVYRTALGV